ncbi:Protein of unknown function [Gryllus bimaculatus]|nr:Protein of unknown function [Gryllus bimaculatus]
MQLNSFYYFVSDKSVRWIIMSLFAFQIKEESGDNKEYITFESIIKVEPCDNIEDTTLLPIVKQDPDDEAEVQIWNFRENAERCFLKREVKEEKEHDDDDDDVEQDPFLMGNESFNGKSISSCVGEYGTFTESHTRVGSSWEKCNSARNKGKDLTSHNAEEKPKQNAEYNKQSENDTRFSSPDNARQEVIVMEHIAILSESIIKIEDKNMEGLSKSYFKAFNPNDIEFINKLLEHNNLSSDDEIKEEQGGNIEDCRSSCVFFYIAFGSILFCDENESYVLLLVMK